MHKTALNEVHHAHGARMVDFCGWEMPLHYGSQIDEHHKVRRDAGMFDVSHMCPIDVAGSGASAFLMLLLVGSIEKMDASGKALYTCMLNEAGGIIDDLIVYRLDEMNFRLVVNAATCDKVLAWFNQHRAASSGSLSIKPRRDLAMIAVQGPEARERFWQAFPEGSSTSVGLKPFYAAVLEAEQGPMLIARTGYTGEDGFEITLPGAQAPTLWQALVEAGVAPCGLGARDTLRIEAGLNLYGQDMDEKTTPYEVGLEWLVDHDENHVCIGKKALLSGEPMWRQVGLLLEPGAGVMRGHQPVFTRCGNGLITSGSYSPTLNRSIALARVPSGTESDEHVEIEIRGKRTPARIVKPPFVRRGKILV